MSTAARPRVRRPSLARLRAWRPDRLHLVLGGILVAALALRLQSITHGLPFVYNPDEEDHFLANAVDMVREGSLNPGYFQNPSALTYLLYAVLRVVDVVAPSVVGDFGDAPGTAFAIGRVVVALLGTLAVAAVYAAGTRFWERRVGLVAAAILAVAFLPVFYSKQALNDAPLILPIALSLLGALWVYERGTRLAFAAAGVAIGLAVSTKYLAIPTAGLVGLAALLRLQKRELGVKDAILGLALAYACTVVVFVLLNPAVIFDSAEFRRQFAGQQDVGNSGKVGQDGTGWTFYPSSLLWGLGALPVLFALAGVVVAFRRDPRRALLLVAFPVVLYVYMSPQLRFFGRWFMPVYPAIAVLAGLAVVALADRLRARRPLVRRPRLAVAVLPVLAALVVFQGLADSWRNGAVLGREDTRRIAERWMDDRIGQNRRVVVEPFVPLRNQRYLDEEVRNDFTLWRQQRPFQIYERRLEPGLLDRYRAAGYCWVATLSVQRDRGLKDGLPGAVAYYRRLERETERRVVFSPYRAGEGPVEFDYDFSFDYYPRAYLRPGPLISIHRLTDCDARPR